MAARFRAGLPTGARFAFNFKVEFCSKANCPEHTHRIFTVARLGVADDTQFAAVQVVQSATVVDDLFGRGIVEQRIDREIATYRIFLTRTKYVVTQNAPMLVGGTALAVVTGMLATKRGHFDHITTA